MKTILFILLLLVSTFTQAQVGIGTTNPASSSILDVTSTTKGLLPPRMTTAQRDAISSPATGLQIYNTDKGAIETFTGNSGVWFTLGRGSGNKISNTAFGSNALGTTNNGDYNTAVGYNALALNTVGWNNCAFGRLALEYNLDGGVNSAFGTLALRNNTNGDYNVAFGNQALFSNIGGAYNTAVGTSSLEANVSGNSNTAVGRISLYSNTTGGQNTGVGLQAGGDNVTGNSNSYLGYNSGLGITGGDYNTIIGANVTGLDTNLSSNIIIANGSGSGAIKAQHDGTNWTLTGGVFVSNIIASGNITASTFTTSSDKRLKRNINPIYNGLNTVMKLNPVVYDKKKTLTSEEYLFKENGFIAQELQLIIPDAVIEGNDENKLLSINYISLIPVLTKAIQELNKVNEEQQKIIKQQKIEYLKLLKRIEALEK